MRGELADDPVDVAELAAADASLRAAYAGVLAAVGDAWASALRGERASRAARARCMMSVQHAIDIAVESTSTAHRLCGGAAAYAGHPLLTSLLKSMSPGSTSPWPINTVHVSAASPPASTTRATFII
jgi:indole-3-acetate monooxygenase